jgi:hypothetical protein
MYNNFVDYMSAFEDSKGLKALKGLGKVYGTQD